ncbi:uncharacterized protein BX664DRAFT_310392 [Halteromyces radiatus]|uniref:uncharacterized protein n=1 Tax=Halteromyces radiatus TaxID=101107 RepID=UPI00221FE5F6|nr:uncharacterized protein BX664DRAFT_310392 [Halteromyces radiatus]KAI8099418.1 hypothetical protein BX664DRAFT_310392 [Halteromyces radiatus]
MSTSTKLPIRSSATLIVAAPIPSNVQKQGECNYRILMMKRNGKSSFVHAHVFPGGVVDSYDNQDDWKINISNTMSSNMLIHKICAIRETFEESGLLLTTPPAHTIPELDTEIWRHKVHEDASQFKYMCDLYKLQPAVDRLIPFANWITPPFEKKRFNTLFFLTVLPQTINEEHKETIKVSSDGKETVQLDWFNPKQALMKYYEKQIVLFPPQWYALYCFNGIQRHEELIDKAGIGSLRTISGDPITIRPQLNVLDDKTKQDEHRYDYDGYLAYPGDEMYLTTGHQDNFKDHILLSPARKGDRHRLYFKDKMQQVDLERNIDISQFVRSNL